MKRWETRFWTETPVEKAIYDILYPFFRPDKKIWFRKRESTIGIHYWQNEKPRGPKKTSELRPLDEIDLQFLSNHIYSCCVTPTQINIGEYVWVIVKNKANKCEIYYREVKEIILRENNQVFAKLKNCDDVEFEYDRTLYCSKALAEKMAKFYELSGEEVPDKRCVKKNNKKEVAPSY